MSLSRSGYLVPLSHPDAKTIKKELTVRPIVNNEFGFPPPPFKVFKETQKNLCVPRFYASDRFGPLDTDTRPEPARCVFNFQGKLRDETFQNDALRKAIEV